MINIITNREDVEKNYPGVIDKWIGYYNNDTRNANDSDIFLFYSYGFFLPKADSPEDRVKIYEDMYEMDYNTRLNFELSKVRVDLFMKIGNFMISDRMTKDIIPEIISAIVGELTKIKMQLECDYYGDEEIRKTIPDFNTSIISIESIKDIFGNKNTEESEYDIDSILDKISESGFESLTDMEKQFLNSKSKNI